MNQKREEAIKGLHGAKAFMNASIAEKKKGIKFKGIKTEIEIDGVTRTFMLYNQDAPIAPAYFDIHGGGSLSLRN